MNVSSLVSTIGSTLELGAFLWAAGAAWHEMRRLQRRVDTIRQMTKDAVGADPSWVKAERVGRGIPPEDTQYGDDPYPRTFVVRDIVEDQVRALRGPGALALVGLVVSLTGNALGI